MEHDEATVSSTSTVPQPDELQPPRESCSRDIVYRGRLTKTIDIVYTDLFLDVSKYKHDVTVFIERVLNTRFTRSTVAEERVALSTTNTNTVVVCSSDLFGYIKGAQGEHNYSQPDSGGFSTCKISVGNGVDIFFCDITMEQAPDRIDRLVTFNVDPFEVSTGVGNRYFVENTSRLKRTFKHIMSADYTSEQKTQSGPITVQLVFSVFSLNERAMETFSASNNVTVRVSDVRFVLIDDSTDRNNAALDFVCNYCSDLMLCLNDDMRPFVVDGEMPFSVDISLISDPLNFIKLQTRTDLLQSVPRDEYFRFKQFYHTFVYGKQNKWGIEVIRTDNNKNNNDNSDSVSSGGGGGGGDNEDEANGDRSCFIDFLNDAMQAELTRLYKILHKTASHNKYEQVNRRNRYDKSKVAESSYSDIRYTDDEEREEMLKARDKLFKVYTACPLLMSGVDVRAITATVDDTDHTSLLKQEHRQMVLSAIESGKRPDRSRQQQEKLKDIYETDLNSHIYDTTTYPHGGDLCDVNVLNTLLATEIAFSSCMVVQNRLAEPSNSRIRYNRFLDDVLFSDMSTTYVR